MLTAYRWHRFLHWVKQSGRPNGGLLLTPLVGVLWWLVVSVFKRFHDENE